jgi:hypothetical protein
MVSPTATATWNGGSDNWTTAADWSNLVVPGFASNGVVSAGDAQITTNVGTIASLNVSAPLDLLDGGALIVTGAVTGTGSFTIDANATLELVGADAETVNFNDASASLKLDNPAAFAGVLNGLIVGDAIDLGGIVVAGAVVSGSVLTVTEANSSTLTFNLSNFPSGVGFSVQSDGAGGSKLIVIPPLANVKFNEVDGNDVINCAQSRAAGGVALSDTVTGLAVGAAAFTATANASTTATQNVTIAETLPIVTIAKIDGNDVINAAQAKAGATLSGAATGLNSGATFQVFVVDGAFSKTYTATIGTGGAWTATIPSADAITLGNGTATVSAQATDAHGDPWALASKSVTVAETSPTVTIAQIDGNDVINAAQAKAGVALSGAATGLASGATFQVFVVDRTFSKTYTATVGTGGDWTATIPSADAITLGNGTNAATVSAQVADAYGNPSALASQSVTAAAAPPTVSVSETRSGPTDLTCDTITKTATASAGLTIAGVEVFDNGKDLGAATYGAATGL